MFSFQGTRGIKVKLADLSLDHSFLLFPGKNMRSPPSLSKKGRKIPSLCSFDVFNMKIMCSGILKKKKAGDFPALIDMRKSGTKFRLKSLFSLIVNPFTCIPWVVLI